MTHLPAPMVPDGYVWEGDGVLPMQGWCQMDSYSCGLVAAFMMLCYFLPDKFPFKGLGRRCAVCPEEGTASDEISGALRSYGLRCRITRSLTKRSVDAAIAAGSPILVGVEGDLLGFEDDHWMVIHGTNKGEVLLANCLYPGRSSQWASWSWLKPGLAPAGWGMVVSA